MTPQELADLVDQCDHLIIVGPQRNTTDEFLVRLDITADDHNLIVEALRLYAQQKNEN